MRQLIQVGVSETEAVLVYVMLNFAGADERQDDLFANENLFSRGKSALKGLQGVDNVYTQHSPHLLQTIDLLMRGKLRTSSYPFAGPDAPAMEAPATVYPGGPPAKPQDVILFVIGGTTYEEARAVALLNGAATSAPGASSAPAWPGTRFLLGGTTVHHSRSFLHMVQHVATTLPPAITRPPPSSGASGLQLRLGPVQLGMREREFGSVASEARELASGLLDRVMRSVDAPL